MSGKLSGIFLFGVATQWATFVLKVLIHSIL